MVTIKEMAKILGISTTTVSNVIHGKTGEVSKQTVARVQRLLEEYDYVPNINARNLARDKSKIIGVAMKYRSDKYDNFFKDPFTAAFLGGLEAGIREKGYFMMTYASDDTAQILHHALTWNVDGLILFGMVGDDGLSISRKYKKPCVYVDCYFDQRLVKYVNIGLDDEQAMYDMTKFLIDHGHKKICFAADNCVGVDGRRYDGFVRAMSEAGLKTDAEDFFMLRPEEMDACMEELWIYAERYTAIACASDFYAAMISNYLQDHGKRIPQDLSVSGFDDNNFASLVRPALTTVHQDAEQRGRKAVEVLVSMLEGAEIENGNILLPHVITVRDSVGALPSL